MTPSAPKPWLDESSPVPVDRPFSRAEARARGVPDRQLADWLDTGLLTSPLRGIYYATQLGDTLDIRIACLRLVAPQDAVITDRTAGWVHGAPMILAPGDHLATPPVSMFLTPGNRLKNGWADSGERTFAESDLMEIGGLLVTTPLRTACDLGRLLHRDQAFAAMDAMAGTRAFTVDQLVAEVPRFKGFRGVRNLRSLSPWVDPRAKSPEESILRLRWLDCETLPRPEPQIEVPGPEGSYFLDLGIEELRYAAEYDGVAWHGPEQQEYDNNRREWVRKELGFVVDVFTAIDIHGRHQNAWGRLRSGIARARRRVGARVWSNQAG